MRMRITGGVAGAAKFFVFYAAYQTLKRSIYGLVCTIEADIDAIEEMNDDIKANPLAYHMGSKYLTGNDQISSDFWSDEDKVTLSAYVWAIMPNSTVAASPTLLREAEVSSSEVYTAFKGLKIALATTANPSVALNIAKKKGLSGTCLWVKLGKITEEELEDAKKEVEEEEKKKKEKKEEKA